MSDNGPVPHIGQLSNQYKEELQILFNLKPLLSKHKAH